MNNNELQWCSATSVGLISSNEVHIWRLLLNEASACIETFQKLLSIDELKKAANFHFEKDRGKFIIARGALRKIIGYYLATKPQEINFQYTSSGKPLIADNQNKSNLHFNVSHSGEVVLYAVTINRNVGIDVELIKDNIDISQIAKRFFSPIEIAAMENTSKKEQSKLFFQFWTRKEALVKATGEGISYPLEQIDASLINGKSLSPSVLPGKCKESLEWHVQDLFSKQNYVAAIAIEVNDYNILCRYYSYDIISMQEFNTGNCSSHPQDYIVLKQR